MELTLVERTLTELDHVRLLNLLRRGARGDTSAPPRRSIEELLEACALVPSCEVAPDIVTMHSQVLVEDILTGQRSTLTLCYPAQAEPAVGRVSVLSPVGTALLGLRAGNVARWFSPAGGEKAAEVRAVLFQPESSGNLSL